MTAEDQNQLAELDKEIARIVEQKHMLIREFVTLKRKISKEER